MINKKHTIFFLSILAIFILIGGSKGYLGKNLNSTSNYKSLSASVYTSDSETSKFPFLFFGKYQCRDGLDNDVDRLIDYPADPGCLSLNDNSEANSKYECSDGIDNSDPEDTLVDMDDPGCNNSISDIGSSYDPNDNDETNAVVQPSCPIYFMGGNSQTLHNDVWCSYDMINWNQLLPNDYTTTIRWSARYLFNSALYFNNKLWVMGNGPGLSQSNDVWSSINGTDWIKVLDNAPWIHRTGFGSVVFNNKMWIFGGQTYIYNFEQLNDVWSSADGVNWTQVTPNAQWSKRTFLAVVNFNNKMWLIGGGNGPVTSPKSDVWSSTNGINWTLENANAFPPREYHTSTVFNGKIWVIGGHGFSSDYDDVISFDGQTWNTEVAHAPWGKISGHSTLVWANKLWLLGGVNHLSSGNVYNTSIWSSLDGINWTQEVVSAPWVPRFYQSTVVAR